MSVNISLIQAHNAAIASVQLENRKDIQLSIMFFRFYFAAMTRIGFYENRKVKD